MPLSPGRTNLVFVKLFPFVLKRTNEVGQPRPRVPGSGPVAFAEWGSNRVKIAGGKSEVVQWLRSKGFRGEAHFLPMKPDPNNMTANGWQEDGVGSKVSLEAGVPGTRKGRESPSQRRGARLSSRRRRPARLAVSGEELRLIRAQVLIDRMRLHAIDADRLGNTEEAKALHTKADKLEEALVEERRFFMKGGG
jgi:hypothetical protein